MAIKTQDQLTEQTTTDPATFWLNGQVSDTGDQKKVQAGNAPFQLEGEVGWANYVDTLYTTGSPLELRTGNSWAAQLTCNGLGSGTTATQWPSGKQVPWDIATNKIMPAANGDAYIARVLMKAQDGASTTLLDLDLDIGGAIGEVWRESKTIAKGASVETSLSYVIPLFVGSTFLANGGTLTLSTITTDMDVWDIQIFLERTYYAH
tara:strand:+ start:17706 stop:18323 length:618 start_codon:yes stop_codon:yes gene_type:complete